MRRLSSLALLAFLGTAAIAAIPKDFQAKNAEPTLFAQQTATPRPTSSPTPTTTPGM